MSAVTWQFTQPAFSFSVLSAEYVQVQVSATLNGAAYDPTADVVALAFKSPGVEPLSADWNAGTWTTTPDSTYLAQVLVGTGGVSLTEGPYVIWIKVTDTPTVPVSTAGTVTITP